MRFTLKNQRFLQYIDYQNVRKNGIFRLSKSGIHYIYKIFFKHSDMKKIFLIFDTSTIDQQEDIVIALNGLLSRLS